VWSLRVASAKWDNVLVLAFVGQTRSVIMHSFYRAGQGARHANLHKWGFAQSPSYYGQRQTMNYIVDMCPLTGLTMIKKTILSQGHAKRLSLWLA